MNRPKHLCKLIHIDEPIVNFAIESGILIDYRRKFRQWFIISDSHPMTRRYFKSFASIKKEALRHLAFNYYTIHPLSKFCLYWEFAIFIVYFIWIISITVRITEQKEEKGPTGAGLSMMIVVDYFLIADMIKTFFTGYYDAEKSFTFMENSFIWRRYLSTYFIFDVIPSSHCIICLMVIITGTFKNYGFLCRYSEYLLLLRIFRLPRILNALRLFNLHVGFSSMASRITQMVLTFLLIFFYILTIEMHSEWVVHKHIIGHNRTFDALHHVGKYYSATMTLLVVTHGMFDLNHPMLLLHVILFMNIGYWLNIYLHSLILQIWNTFTHSKMRNVEMLQQFAQYIKHVGLSIALRKKCRDFFTFKYQDRFYHQAHIDMLMSEQLRQDITAFIAENYIKKVELLDMLPSTLTTKLVRRIKSEIFITNDIIFKAGHKGSCMYFIYYGTVAVYYEGKEICHLHDGDHFGAVALISNRPRIATVQAVTPCELLVLTKTDFLMILETHPEFKEKMAKDAERRYNYSKVMLAKGKSGTMITY